MVAELSLAHCRTIKFAMTWSLKKCCRKSHKKEYFNSYHSELYQIVQMYCGEQSAFDLASTRPEVVDNITQGQNKQWHRLLWGGLTSGDTVPRTTISCSIHKAAVIIVFTARWSVWVRHSRVKRRITASQALKNSIIRAGAVLMSTA